MDYLADLHSPHQPEGKKIARIAIRPDKRGCGKRETQVNTDLKNPLLLARMAALVCWLVKSQLIHLCEVLELKFKMQNLGFMLMK